jgi:hypothetical protein
MAYEKNQWAGRQGTGLNKFTKSQETDTTVYLDNTPDSITEPGTPFSVEKMNRIEQGIADAHEAVEIEARSREEEDQNLETQISDEAEARQQGDGALLEALSAEASAREEGDAAVLAVSVRRDEIGAANGVAGLDGGGKVPASQLPATGGGAPIDSPEFTGQPTINGNPVAAASITNDPDEVDLPVGSYVLVNGSEIGVNNLPLLNSDPAVALAGIGALCIRYDKREYSFTSASSYMDIPMSGAWRISGRMGSGNSLVFLARRVA